MSRNPIARDLRTPKYRERVIADKRRDAELLAAAEALDQAYAESDAFHSAFPQGEHEYLEWEDLQKAALNRGQP
jgi:hypothetical protein